MATVFRCDRCGSEYTDRSKMGTIEFPRVLAFDELGEERRVDLCIACVGSLTEWVKPLVNNKNKESAGIAYGIPRELR